MTPIRWAITFTVRYILGLFGVGKGKTSYGVDIVKAKGEGKDVVPG